MNTESIKQYIRGAGTKKIGIIITSIAGAILIFHFGTELGYRRAQFYSGNGERYLPFDKAPKHRGMMGALKDDTSNSHGVRGRIITINPPKFTVEDDSNVEKIILTTDDTIVRKFRDEIHISDLEEGDFIITIGSPNENSEIQAKLIRVLPPPPIQ